MRRVGYLVGLLVPLLASCVASGEYPCTSSADCQNGAATGVCEPTGFCSFADPGCLTTPRRYGSLAPSALANRCVADILDSGMIDGNLADGGDGGSDAARDGAATLDAALDGAMRDGAPIDTAMPIDAAVAVDAARDAGPVNCWTGIASGTEHVCVFKSDGSMSCWGNSMDGRLGGRVPTTAGMPVLAASPPAVQRLGLGDDFTCAVATDSDTWCVGGNGSGQIGDGTVNDHLTSFTHVRTGVGVFLPAAFRVGAGLSHACAQLSGGGGGQIYCWGANLTDELGQDTATFGNQSLFAVPVAGVTGARSMAVGNYHNCYVQDLPVASSVWCFGRGTEGQLGRGATLANSAAPVQAGTIADVRQLAAGAYATCAINGSGEVWCWGRNDEGRFGVGDTADRNLPAKMLGLPGAASRVAVGDQHICVLVSGSVYCAGTNDAGRLGLAVDPPNNRATMPVKVPALSGIVDLSANYQGTCAIRSDGVVLCWGGNDAGQIGVPPATLSHSAAPLPIAVTCP